MGSIARLAQLELRAPGNHLLAEVDKCLHQIAQVHDPGTPAAQRKHVDAERCLQAGKAIELVQHNVGVNGLGDLDNHAHAVTIGLVAEVDDALDPLFARDVGNLLHQVRFVHLIRSLGHDNRSAFAFGLFKVNFAANDHRAAPGP